MTDQQDEPKRIEVDIGAAIKMLEASPELADAMNKLIGGPALVEALAKIERLRATLQLESEYRRNAVAEATWLQAVVRDAIEAIERGSTSAPILEVLKATLGGTEQKPGD